MPKKHLGVQPHHKNKSWGANPFNHDPSTVPQESPLALLLKKNIPEYQPFDVVRHHNHMGTPYAQLNLAHVPDVFGFWGTSPYADGMDG